MSTRHEAPRKGRFVPRADAIRPYSSSGEAVPFIQPLSPASGRVDYESPPTGCIAIFQQKSPPESKKRIYFFRKI